MPRGREMQRGSRALCKLMGGQVGRSPWWWTIRLGIIQDWRVTRRTTDSWVISPDELLLSRLPKIGEDYWCWVSAMGMGRDLKMK